MVVRFFNSMEKGESGTAVRQGEKLLALNPGRTHIQTLISIQESNEAIRNAQRHLDRRRINTALQKINDALKTYPDNDVLRRSRIKLTELTNAEKYFREMDRAKTASAMNEARETIESGLSNNHTPKLREYLLACEDIEKGLALKEQQNTQASLEAASAAAEKAKAEDAAREAENIRFMEDMAKMTDAGEKMRQEAGEVPFETEQSSAPETQKNDQ